MKRNLQIDCTVLGNFHECIGKIIFLSLGGSSLSDQWIILFKNNTTLKTNKGKEFVPMGFMKISPDPEYLNKALDEKKLLVTFTCWVMITRRHLFFEWS